MAANRDLIHKIGITGGRVKDRIAGAEREPTYMLAKVEVVSAYMLANVNRNKLEYLLHQDLPRRGWILKLQAPMAGRYTLKNGFWCPCL